MIEVKAPQHYDFNKEKTYLFLGGSIEMGKAEDWQKELTKELSDYNDDLVLFNPRRDDWDSSWVQSIHNPNFREQVEWELQAQDDSDIIVYYFAPGTQSPITLLELGLYAHSPMCKVIVCCPDGFWRKGNIEIVCKRHNIKFTESKLEMYDILHANLPEWYI